MTKTAIKKQRMADGPLPYEDIIGIIIIVGGIAIFNDKVSVSGLKDTPIDGLIDALATYVFDNVSSFVSSIDLKANWNCSDVAFNSKLFHC